MRRYETIFIVDPDLSEQDRGQIFDRTKDLIEKYDGFLAIFDEWGAKKLAYEINKKMRGYYVCMNFCGEGDMVSEIERTFKLDDRVMKFMTLLLEKDTDIETVKAELAQAEEEKDTASEEKAETTTDETTETVGEEE